MNAITFISAYRQLSPVEKRFVDDYVEKMEQAAARAQERLSLQLHRPVQVDQAGMLQRPMVKAAISERVTELIERNELTPERVIKELTSIAFANHNDYLSISYDGRPSYDLSKCTPEQLAAVKKITYEQTSTGSERLVFETHDKLAALDRLAKYMGLLELDNPHWRSSQARPIIEQGASTEQAADKYQRFIGD